ncbi:modulator of smoothened protein isoform X2 [Myotis myotis]|uniref:modulator of smoothened protein isoform X2 n=1 Tax=Myotis myotis TaxID=51298 RepID=UPI00174B006A|nr:modulator of smoothened protein isoform X2 [Myotis myotis]
MSLSRRRYLRHRQHRQPRLDQHRGVRGASQKRFRDLNSITELNNTVHPSGRQLGAAAVPADRGAGAGGPRRHLLQTDVAVPFADEETYSERGMIWRSTHCGPCATVSDNPWTRPNMHPTSAAPGVGDHTVFYHHGNHFIDCHMWFAGGFPLAKRSYKICSMDSIHWKYPRESKCAV